MRSSFRIYDAGSGEVLFNNSRIGDEEICYYSFSHDKRVDISNHRATDEKYRLELWVADKGSYFEVEAKDIFFKNGVYNPGEDETCFDITDYGDFIEGSKCYLEDTPDIKGMIDDDGKAVFEGDVSDEYCCFKYKINGAKGFLSVPIVGDGVTVKQIVGNRELKVRYLKEGENA
jgi:hypothetical protein